MKPSKVTDNLCTKPDCGKPARSRGLCAYHYRRWLQVQGRIGRLYRCRNPDCRSQFRSAQQRPFCSFSCYLASPLRKRHDRERAKRMTKARKQKCLGPGCEIHMPVPPCQARRGRRFCSQACYRAYLAERFDRWVANPRSVERLQGFDEFLCQEQLPCLIEGCGWQGKNLGQHVNREHGLTAEQFKELAGFNRCTGLVAPDTQRRMTQQALENRKYGLLRNGPGNPAGRKGQRLRPEHLEHLEKARALKQGELE